MKAIEIIGLGCGNEGKAKISDFLASDAKYVIRDTNTVGENHTVYLDKDTSKSFIYLPSGFNKAIKVITNNVFLDLNYIIKVIDNESISADDLKISFDAFFYLPWHAGIKDPLAQLKEDIINNKALQLKDLYRGDLLTLVKDLVKNQNKLLTGKNKELYDTKYIFDLLNTYAIKLRPYLCDTNLLIASANDDDKLVLEGSTSILPYFLPDSNKILEVTNIKSLNRKLFSETIGVVKTFLSSKDDINLPTKIANEQDIHHFLNNGEEYSAKTKSYNYIYWLDTVLLRYLIKVNGITKIALTFLDTLTGLPKIKVCKSYNYKGCELTDFPSELTDFTQVVPNYVELKGWESDLSKVKKLKDVPKTVLKFVKALEELLDCEIAIISFGKSRFQTVELKGI